MTMTAVKTTTTITTTTTMMMMVSVLSGPLGEMGEDKCDHKEMLIEMRVEPSSRGVHMCVGW